MIYSVKGELRIIEPYFIVVECGGIGYSVKTSMTTVAKLPQTGQETMIYTYLYVREDILEMYGFADLEELELFKLLISVSGVGPKAAILILSDMDTQKFALCVASGDYKSLTKVQGIGAKTAQRIVLELKDKVAKGAVSGTVMRETLSNVAAKTGNANEAVSALEALGYSRADAASVISRLDGDTPVEEMIKSGLKALAGKM